MPLWAGIEGLKVSIRTNKKVYLLEEPIECRFTFKNNGTKYAEIKNTSENPVPIILKLIILDKLGRSVEYNHLEIDEFKLLDFQKYYVRLSPSDSLVKFDLINDPFDLISCSALREKPGMYKIAIKYCDDWKSETAYSDTTIIEIKRPDTRTDAYALELYRKANSMDFREEHQQLMNLYLKIANDLPNCYYAPYAFYLYAHISTYDACFSDRLSPIIAIERAKEYINRYPDFGQNATLGKIFFLELHRCYEKTYGNEAYRQYLNELQEKNPNTILYQSIERTKEFFKWAKKYFKDLNSPW